jgi:hypothetical protein
MGASAITVSLDKEWPQFLEKAHGSLDDITGNSVLQCLLGRAGVFSGEFSSLH